MIAFKIRGFGRAPDCSAASFFDDFHNVQCMYDVLSSLIAEAVEVRNAPASSPLESAIIQHLRKDS